MFENIRESPNYRWHIVAAVSIGTFMATLDSNIVNVAMPTISGQFQTSLSMLQWIVTAYLLTISSLLPIFGRLADMLGRKKVYTLGFLIFTGGSALCGLSPNLAFLVTARVLQAIGASMLMSNSMAIVSAAFPPSGRGKALGITGTVVALGSLTGPALGGILIGLAGWRSIFFINVPIGIIGYLVALLVLPADQPGKEREKFDFAGAILFATGMLSLLFAINNGTDRGWKSLPILLGLGAGIVLLSAFGYIERKVANPMIDFSIFRNRAFLIGNLSGYLTFVAMFANAILLPFFLQQILHYQPSQIGLLMMATPFIMAFVAPLSGHASDKHGPVLLTSGGLAITAAGLFYFSTLTASASFWQVIPGPILMGLGTGLFQSPNNTSVMNAVTPQKMGVAGSISSLVRNLGMVTGIAFSITLFEGLGGTSAPSPGQTATFMSAYHAVMLVAMTIALVGMVISLNRKVGKRVKDTDPKTPVSSDLSEMN